MIEPASPTAARATFEFDLTPDDIIQAQLSHLRARGRIGLRLPHWRQTVTRVNAGALQHTVATLSTSGVDVQQADARFQSGWGRYESAFETDNAFVLVFRGGAAFTILPKQGIKLGQISDVRALVLNLPARPGSARTPSF